MTESTDPLPTAQAESTSVNHWPMRLGCGLLVLASLFVVVLPCTRTVTQAIQRTTVSHNARSILRSLHDYHELHGHFPPARSIDEHGNVRSWRTLLPHTLGSGYVEGDVWNSQANQRVVEEMPYGGHSQHGYVCLAIVGDSTMWSPDGTPRTDSDAEDGNTDTGLMLMLKDTGIDYWEPRDLLFDGKRLTIEGDEGRSINYENAILGFVDGSARLILAEDAEGLLVEFLNRNDGKPTHDDD